MYMDAFEGCGYVHEPLPVNAVKLEGVRHLGAISPIRCHFGNLLRGLSVAGVADVVE